MLCAAPTCGGGGREEVRADVRHVEEVLVVDALLVPTAHAPRRPVHQTDQVEEGEEIDLLWTQLGHAIRHARRHLGQVEQKGEKRDWIWNGLENELQQQVHLVVERH